MRDFDAEFGPSRWRLDREFTRPSYRLGKRKDITHGVKADVARRNCGACVKTICELDVDDFIKAVLCVGRGGSVRRAPARPEVPSVVKTCLGPLKISAAKVVGTDRRRVDLWQVLTNHTHYFGPSVIFATPNLAETSDLPRS